MDSASIAAATGWTVHHLPVAASTNDTAAALVRDGAGARTVVVADRQSAGRGRLGRPFVSPPGGLYVSLVLEAAREDLPAPIVALAGVASAEAIEQVSGVAVRLKWPNDLQIAGRKVGGILLETSDGTRKVVVGIGINLRGVPAALGAEERKAATSLDAEAAAPVGREDVLRALLKALDAWLEQRPGGWHDVLEGAWRARLALIGEPVTFVYAGRELEGVLEDASLRGGLLVRDAVSGPVWRQAEHVQDLRPAARTIP